MSPGKAPGDTSGLSAAASAGSPAVTRAIAQTPPQFACDRGDHDLFRLTRQDHLSIAPAQPGLRLPGDLAHRLRHSLDRRQFRARDPGGETVAPGGLDQNRARVDIAAFGDAALTPLRTRRMFRRHPAEIGDESAGRGEAGGVADGGGQTRGADRVQSAQGGEVPHQIGQGPGGNRGPRMRFDPVAALFGQARGLDAFFQNQLVYREIEAPIRQPAAMRLGPGSLVLGVNALVTQKKRAQLLACRPHRAHPGQTGPDQIAHGFVRGIRYPDRGQQTRPMRQRQGGSVRAAAAGRRRRACRFSGGLRPGAGSEMARPRCGQGPGGSGYDERRNRTGLLRNRPSPPHRRRAARFSSAGAAFGIFPRTVAFPPASATAATMVSLCTSRPTNRVGSSMTRLLCLRLHAGPSGGTLDHRHEMRRVTPGVAKTNMRS